MTVKSEQTYGRGTKLTALAVAFVFAVTSVTWTTPAVAATADVVPSVNASIGSLTIPPEMGTITETYRGERGTLNGEHEGVSVSRFPLAASRNDRTVILIQDAHALIDAQENIVKILGHLRKNYDVRLTALEGAKGRLEPVLLRTFPDPGVKRKILAGYEKRAELSGPEMAAILEEKAGDYRGMENWDLYEKNYFAYLRAQEKKASLLAQWNAFKQTLDSERAKVYDSKLNEFEDVRESFLAERASLLDLLIYLSKFKDLLKTTSGYQELPKLLESIGYEQSGKPGALQPLVRKIADEFKAKYLRGLGVKTEMNFYNRYQAFMAGQITPGQMLQYLVQLGSESGKAVRLPPALKKLLGHSEVLSEIKGSRLADELQGFLSQVESSLIKTPAERELADKYRKLFLLKEMISLELIHEDLARYQKEPDAYLGLIADPEFKQALAPALEFYQTALERDHAFFENIMSMMEKETPRVPDFGLRTVAVVAGGFHTHGLERLLKEKGVAYAVVAPKIASLAGQENYAKVMKGDVSFKDGLKTTYFDALMRHAAKSLVEALPIQDRVMTLKVWRDNVIREFAAGRRIAEVGKYLPYIDEILQGMPDAVTAVSSQQSKEEILDGVGKELEKFKKDSLERIWKTFEFQLDIFTDGLKQLIAKKDLSTQRVSALLDRASQSKPSFVALIQSLDPSIRVIEPSRVPESVPAAAVTQSVEMAPDLHGPVRLRQKPDASVRSEGRRSEVRFKIPEGVPFIAKHDDLGKVVEARDWLKADPSQLTRLAEELYNLELSSFKVPRKEEGVREWEESLTHPRQYVQVLISPTGDLVGATRSYLHQQKGDGVKLDRLMSYEDGIRGKGTLLLDALFDAMLKRGEKVVEFVNRDDRYQDFYVRYLKSLQEKGILWFTKESSFYHVSLLRSPLNRKFDPLREFLGTQRSEVRFKIPEDVPFIAKHDDLGKVVEVKELKLSPGQEESLAEELYKLELEAFPEFEADKATWAESIHDPNKLVFALFNLSGTMVAGVCVTLMPRSDFAVLEAFMSLKDGTRGKGAFLLDSVLSEMKRRDITDIRWVFNSNSKSFYDNGDKGYLSFRQKSGVLTFKQIDEIFKVRLLHDPLDKKFDVLRGFWGTQRSKMRLNPVDFSTPPSATVALALNELARLRQKPDASVRSEGRRSEVRFEIPANVPVIASDPRLGEVIDVKRLGLGAEQMGSLAKSLYDLSALCYSQKEQKGMSVGQWQDTLEDPDQSVYILRNLSGAIVGAAVGGSLFTLEGKKGAWLDRLMSRDDNVRGKGTFLLDAFLSQMSRQGIKIFRWNFSRFSEDFYLNEEKGYLKPRQDAGMLKRLKHDYSRSVTPEGAIEIELLEDSLKSKFNSLREFVGVSRSEARFEIPVNVPVIAEHLILGKVVEARDWLKADPSQLTPLAEALYDLELSRFHWDRTEEGVRKWEEKLLDPRQYVQVLISPDGDLAGATRGYFRSTAGEGMKLDRMMSYEDGIRGRGTLLLHAFLDAVLEGGETEVHFYSNHDQSQDFYDRSLKSLQEKGSLTFTSDDALYIVTLSQSPLLPKFDPLREFLGSKRSEVRFEIPEKAVIKDYPGIGKVVDVKKLGLSQAQLNYLAEDHFKLESKAFPGEEVDRNAWDASFEVPYVSVFTLMNSFGDVVAGVRVRFVEPNNFAALEMFMSLDDGIRGKGTLLLDSVLREIMRRGVTDVRWSFNGDSKAFYDDKEKGYLSVRQKARVLIFDIIAGIFKIRLLQDPMDKKFDYLRSFAGQRAEARLGPVAAGIPQLAAMEGRRSEGRIDQSPLVVLTGASAVQIAEMAQKSNPDVVRAWFLKQGRSELGKKIDPKIEQFREELGRYGTAQELISFIRSSGFQERLTALLGEFGDVTELVSLIRNRVVFGDDQPGSVRLADNASQLDVGKIALDQALLDAAAAGLLMNAKEPSFVLLMDRPGDGIAEEVLAMLATLKPSQLIIYNAAKEKPFGRAWQNKLKVPIMPVGNESAVRRAVKASSDLVVSFWTQDRGMNGLGIYSILAEIGRIADPRLRELALTAVRVAILRFATLDKETQGKILAEPSTIRSYLEQFGIPAFIQFNAQGLVFNIEQLVEAYTARQAVEKAA